MVLPAPIRHRLPGARRQLEDQELKPKPASRGGVDDLDHPWRLAAREIEPPHLLVSALEVAREARRVEQRRRQAGCRGEVPAHAEVGERTTN